STLSPYTTLFRSPGHLTGIQDGVAPLAQVHERGFHGGQHVLHPAEVDVTDHRGLGLARDVVLHQHVVLEHGDLGAPLHGAHHHLSFHRLAPGEELGLGDDRPAPVRVPALFATLSLGLQASGALQRGDLVTGAAVVPARASTTAAPAPAPRASAGLTRLVAVPVAVPVAVAVAVPGGLGVAVLRCGLLALALRGGAGAVARVGLPAAAGALLVRATGVALALGALGAARAAGTTGAAGAFPAPTPATPTPSLATSGRAGLAVRSLVRGILTGVLLPVLVMLRILCGSGSGLSSASRPTTPGAGDLRSLEQQRSGRQPGRVLLGALFDRALSVLGVLGILSVLGAIFGRPGRVSIGQIDVDLHLRIGGLLVLVSI